MSISIPRRWAERGLYDLETARAMLQSERFVYVPFCCQQAVEKLIKGLVAKSTGKLPPRTHNLMLLAKRAGLEPGASQALLMRELTEYYVQSRYPEEIEPTSSMAWRDAARNPLERTEELVQWLTAMI